MSEVATAVRGKFGMTEKHKALQETAIRWLYARGCSVFAKEVPTQNGVADALGIKMEPAYRHDDEKGTVYYIEAKASRSDLICLKQKATYYRCFEGKNTLNLEGKYEPNHDAPRDLGIDYYYLIVADGVKVEDALYPYWGVLNEKGEVLRKAKRFPRKGSFGRQVREVSHVLVYKVFGKLYLQ